MCIRDRILHVRDISHPETEEQAGDVGEILESLGVEEDVPLIEVWNKIDALSGETRSALRRHDARTEGVQAISALSGEGLEDLLLAVETRLAEVLDEPRDEAVLILPSDDGRRRAWLHRQGIVASEEMGDKGVRLLVRWTARQKAAYEAL